ncbi:hypothetical protein ASF51_01740 [Agreia sp. Leaf283]|nr:hypothetical protein ASF51_01740 [Agreia sp. Leaf283]
MLPKAIRKTFTLREFARLVSAFEWNDSLRQAPYPSSDIADLHAFVDVVRRMRGLEREVIEPLDDDIVDPYKESQNVYDEAGRVISGAVRTVAEAFARLVGDSSSGLRATGPIQSNLATDLQRSSFTRFDR